MNPNVMRRSVQVDADVLAQIFSLLPLRSLAKCACVCRSWHHAVEIAWGNACENVKTRYGRSLYAKDNAELDAVGLEQCRRFMQASSVVSWQAHVKRINCSHWTMDTFATGSGGGTIRIWSLSSSTCVEEYGTPNRTSVVAMDIDQTKVLGASDSHIYLWKRAKNKARKIGGHQRLYSMCCIDPQVAAGCADGTIRIYDLYGGQCSLLLRQHSEPVNCLAFSADLHVLASGSSDSTVRLCDPNIGETTARFAPTRRSSVSCLEMLDDGSKLVAGTSVGDVHCWDLRKTKWPLWSESLGASEVTSVHHREYGPGIVFGSYSGTLLLRLGPSSRRSLRHNKFPVLSVKMGSSGVLSCHVDGTVSWWKFCDPVADLATGSRS